ncbi:MAG: hypothetical protein KIS66_04205 [Fimbriimonadaceae bacterium]|nr:hypothetical protein [Fimbriimonadaceae bacterium]
MVGLVVAVAITASGWVPLHPFAERELLVADPVGVRAILRTPANLDPAKPVPVIVFATPNGNTAEQTLGTAVDPNTDWHFGIQHVAAQARWLREVGGMPNLCLVVAQANSLSWPAWRRATPKAAEESRRLFRGWLDAIPGRRKEVTLTCHSGGGSFLWAYLEGAPAIDREVNRIAWLDANYSFEADAHRNKLLAWLQGSRKRELSVLAYDDRRVTLDGKPIVSETGGTYRATDRMLAALGPGTVKRIEGEWEIVRFHRGQAEFRVHRNPRNEILHTRLVGDMNGLLWLFDRNASLAEQRRYLAFVSPPARGLDLTGLPPRRPDALGGQAWIENAALLEREARESSIFAAILDGNVPSFLRRWVPVRLGGAERTVVVLVQPDCLAVGSDDDFVRLPMNPITAQAIADRSEALLMTDRISDAVHAQADLRLDPRPLTMLREATSTFARHSGMIEEQRAGSPLGLLIAGIKKDVVLTNRLLERPGRVAIYGWHHPDGRPIQPLTTVHVDWYVDYSHGIRLVSRRCWANGQERDLRDLLRDPDWAPLLASEGALRLTSYSERPPGKAE